MRGEGLSNFLSRISLSGGPGLSLSLGHQGPQDLRGSAGGSVGTAARSRGHTAPTKIGE